MSDIKWETVDIPEVKRERKPNPHKPTVQQLIDSKLALAFRFPVKTDEQEKAMLGVVNAMQRAGRELGVTVAKKIVKDNGVATLTVWAEPKRERKAEDKAEDKASTKGK